MSKKKNSSVKKKKKTDKSGIQRKFFGNVEYIEDEWGRVIEIKATNGTFSIKRNPFLDSGNSR